MTVSEQQPELRWAPMEPKPKRTGRIWLIIGLVVAALLVVGALLFFLLPRGDAPDAGSSPDPTATATPGSPEETPEPALTPPAPVDPTIDVFREQVGGWLTDAPRGLDIIARASDEDALTVIDTLEQDAIRLSDAQPPSSIASQWRDGVGAYAQRLGELRTAIGSSEGTSGALEAARAAAADLSAIAGI